MLDKPSLWPGFKHWLKLGRWRMRRMLSSLRWGPEDLAKTPAVLGNAMPKSGSHLIIQVLQGLTHLGPFVNPGFPPVNRTEDNRNLSVEAVLANIYAMRSGDIGYGYVQARQPFIDALTRPGVAMVFVYRDPRDMIVSHVFYATEMHSGHGMHRYYTEVLQTMEERINAAIQGVDEEGAELSNVKEKYERYLGWLEIPEVLCIRFEDLILDRDNALAQLLNYLEKRGFSPKKTVEQSILTLKAAIAPARSGTFRRGKPGNWQEYFTPANKALFKEVASILLIQLGYEKDNGW
jgi:sulfotransferase 6B1